MQCIAVTISQKERQRIQRERENESKRDTSTNLYIMDGHKIGVNCVGMYLALGTVVESRMGLRKIISIFFRCSCFSLF